MSKIYEPNIDRIEGRNSSTIIVEDFNSPFSLMDRTPRQKIDKEIENLNKDVDQLDLPDTYTTLFLTRTHNLLKCTWNMHHMFSQKISLNIEKD